MFKQKFAIKTLNTILITPQTGDLLAQEEAKLVAKDLDINPELIVNSTYSLAQLFAIKNNKLKLLKQQNSAPSFGFKK